jgi:hypothetical protein
MGGSGNSGEESRSRGGGFRRAKAWSSSGRVRGTLWTNARARDKVKSTSHRTGVVNRRSQTPARPNWLRQGGNKINQAWERVHHLRIVLGTALRGLWRAGRPTTWPQISGEHGR